MLGLHGHAYFSCAGFLVCAEVCSSAGAVVTVILVPRSTGCELLNMRGTSLSHTPDSKHIPYRKDPSKVSETLQQFGNPNYGPRTGESAEPGLGTAGARAQLQPAQM